MSLIALTAVCQLMAGSSVSAEPPAALRIAADHRGFEVEGQPWAPVGVNHFPPDVGWAPQLWKRFDRDRVERDFRALPEYGVNTVRVFLTAGSFLPEPPSLDEGALRKLDQLLQIAQQHSIRVMPTGPDH